MNHYPLKSDEFQQLLNFKDWNIHEVSFDDIQRIPNIPRRPDAVAVFASGDMSATKVLNGITAVFGMDVIVHERRPNILKNEPDLNIYHCVIHKLDNPHNGYSYIMHGPSSSETLFKHWEDESILDLYINLAKRTENESAEQGGPECLQGAGFPDP